jgi:hypothetical protein
MKALSLALGTIILCVGALAVKFAKKEQGCEAVKKSTFTIAKDTTYFTSPLDQDGYVDYATAVNERLRQGVTPENNANVLYWKAFGPRDGYTKVTPEYFHWLQMPEPPEAGNYFVGLIPFMNDRFQGEGPRDIGELEDLLSDCSSRPWTSKEFPFLTQWLKANNQSLSLIVDGSQRPRYFMPQVWYQSQDGTKGFKVVPNLQACRQALRA